MSERVQKKCLKMASKTGKSNHFSISGLLAFSDDPEPFDYDFIDSNTSEEFENEFAKHLKPIKQRVCHICQIPKKPVKMSNFL